MILNIDWHEGGQSVHPSWNKACLPSAYNSIIQHILPRRINCIETYQQEEQMHIEL